MKVLELTKGYVAIISDEDYHRVTQYSWHVHISRGKDKKPGQPYARSNIRGEKVYLHRFIKKFDVALKKIEGIRERGYEYTDQEVPVDHKNHQTLDCRRENLRVCLHLENQLNRRNVRK